MAYFMSLYLLFSFIIYIIQLGYGREDPLKLKDVFKFDSYHYHGCDAVSKCIRTLGIR